MSYTRISITSHNPLPDDPHVAGIYYGQDQVRVGDHIASHDYDSDEFDEATGYPYSLPNGDTLDDDGDVDQLRAALRVLGYGVETDDEGLVLVEIDADATMRELRDDK